MLIRDTSLLPYFQPNGIEAGLDEAGRGCLAGPVVAAAVILPKDFHDKLLTDSKQLNAKQRQQLIEVIKTYAIDYAIAEADHETIDQINIYKASVMVVLPVIICGNDQLKARIFRSNNLGNIW